MTCNTTPTSRLVQHIDFQRVDAKTKLHMKVPRALQQVLKNPPAVKIEQVHGHPRSMTELDVTCMPSDLPEFIAVDLSAA